MPAEGAAPLEADPARRAVALAFRHLLPLLVVMHLIAYADRVNITFAETELTRDLAISSTVFGLAAGIFFASYVVARDPEQPRLAPGRGAPLDGSHHDQLGDRRGRDGVRVGRDLADRRPDPARRRGGRLLPRRRLPDLVLVPRARPRPRRGHLHARNRGGCCRRRPALGRHARARRRARPRGLAVALPRRRHPRDRGRLLGAARAAEHPGRSALAARRGAGGAGARARRRGGGARGARDVHPARRLHRRSHPALRRRLLHDQLRELRDDLLVRRHRRARRRRRGHRARPARRDPDGARIDRPDRDRTALGPQRRPPPLGDDRDAAGRRRPDRYGASCRPRSAC